MAKQKLHEQAYRFLVRNWNSIVAGVSLVAVAVFALIPPLSKYLPIFYFAAANAVVWTVIEIKIALRRNEEAIQVYGNMRQARTDIVMDVTKAAQKSKRTSPVKVNLVGGRIRSMSDIVREVADDLSSGRVNGHVEITLSSVAPDYVANRILPGQVSVEAQRERNARYAQSIMTTSQELQERANFDRGSSSCKIEVVNYKSDPTFYGIAIDGKSVYWGHYTWDHSNADWVGPENGCVRMSNTSEEYDLVRSWIENRSRLNIEDGMTELT